MFYRTDETGAARKDSAECGVEMGDDKNQEMEEKRREEDDENEGVLITFLVDGRGVGVWMMMRSACREEGSLF